VVNGSNKSLPNFVESKATTHIRERITRQKMNSAAWMDYVGTAPNLYRSIQFSHASDDSSPASNPPTSGQNSKQGSKNECEYYRSLELLSFFFPKTKKEV
jgi:hypothetical protein